MGTPSDRRGRQLVPSPITSTSVDLDKLDDQIHTGVDLVDYTLSGEVRPVHRLGYHNFISCTFDHAAVREVDLTRCDFKDCLVKNSIFSNCRINAATHAATMYVDSTFEKCDFSNAVHVSCEYRNVRFIACNLSNLLMKNSRLYDCIFVDCATETHVFEGNVFLETTFERTTLEVRTVTSNFGLKMVQFADCLFRSRRASEDHVTVEPASIADFVDPGSQNPLLLLSVRYFLDGNLLGGGGDLDKAFDVKSWIRLAKQPSSFSELIEQLAEFLANAYENDELNIHKILVLHDITRRIVTDDSRDAHDYRFNISFGGIHLVLSRIVEDYLATFYNALRTYPANIFVVARGSLSRAYFEKSLEEFLTHCGVRLVSVKPHNSPVQLEFAELLPGGRFYALAIILASFVRFELRAVPAELPKIGGTRGSSRSKAKDQLPAPVAAFFEISSGLTTDAQRAYELRVKSLIPTTSIVLDLKLSVSTQFVRKLRSVFVRVLREDEARAHQE